MYERIMKLIEHNKLNVAETERRANLSQGQIRRYNKITPRIDNLFKIATYFNVSLDYLVGLSDIKHQNTLSPELSLLLNLAQELDPKDLALVFNLMMRLHQNSDV